jgi:hypothetical protein
MSVLVRQHLLMFGGLEGPYRYKKANRKAWELERVTSSR